MDHRLRNHIGRLGLPALIAALAALTAPAALAVQISNTPLASASNLAVKPNLMFILDDSGSMNFDALPDNAEFQQGGGTPWDQDYSCKLRVGSGGQSANFCDRVDPPFGAVDFNGMYYNPQQRYRAAVKADGTSMGDQTSSGAVVCDPFSGLGCKDNYVCCTSPPYPNPGTPDADQSNFAYYYKNGKLCTSGSSCWDNSGSNVKLWYGTGTTFSMSAFPEVVYCRSTSGVVTNYDDCRRNGIAIAGDTRQTGNPFRYNNQYYRNGYPESNATHEFWRKTGSTNTTVTVTMGRFFGVTCTTYPCTTLPNTVPTDTNYPTLSAPYKIIPRTNTGTSGSGFDTCSGATCKTATVNVAQLNSASSFDYSITSRTGQNLSGNGQFDMIVAFKNGSGNCAGTPLAGGKCTVYVTAPNHGLNPGDQIKVYLLTAETSIIAADGNTVTVCGAYTGSPCPTLAPTTNTFAYTLSTATSASKSSTGFFQRTALYNIPKLRNTASNPFYYTIEPVEYCSDEALTTCTASTTATGAYTYPAPVRFCLTDADANRMDTPTGPDRVASLPRCQKKYREFPSAVSGTGYSYRGYVYARYGQFRRKDIVSATATYPRGVLRSDCISSTSSCSYTEEMTNFANWFAYYRFRMQMMKTSGGIAFAPLNDSYRVGFVTINFGSSSEYLKINDFTTSHKSSWYTTFYSQAPGGGTPLTTALSRAGRHFAGKTDGVNAGMSDDPVQYSCQQNFALLTTDGYWNYRGGKSLTDTDTSVKKDSIGNQDNTFNCSSTDPKSVCRPAWDGYGTAYTSGEFSTAGNLSDVAQYYYNNDLRTSGAVSDNNVPTGENDKANWQHMVTFGLGMAEGLMNWRKDYESADSGDYYKIKNGLSGCSWDSQCRWPVPGDTRPENLDDLWHAAVNGHGKFFYARDTGAVQQGLQDALTNLSQRDASGAAAATSTSSITPTDRGIFQSVYTTVKWNGDIIAQFIDPNTGKIQSGIAWQARDLLQGRVSSAADTRKIYTFDSTASDGLKSFDYNNLTAAEKAFFDNKCTPLTNMTQCATLDTLTDLPLANDGKNLVGFLRGQTQYEAKLFRDRQFALGDTVNSVPLFVGKPKFAFIDAVTPTYSDWATGSSIQSRTPTLYVGANDGMLHAFNANSGQEQWAYIPRMLLPKLWMLAEQNYATKHQYYVDGSPSSMDVYDGSTWRTILVGGLNSGGSGYYALDITNPAAPKALWEFCTDSSLCTVTDKDLGLTYGNPLITKRKSDGRWVVLVTSGYNNDVTGDGKGYLYVLDALTGTRLDKVTGSPAWPIGLAKLNGWYDNFTSDNTATALYGGDLQGKIWEFDMRTSTIQVTNIAQALDGSNKPQPITTKPELGLVNDVNKVMYIGTGRYLGTPDLTDPATQTPAGSDAWQQSFYAFKITPDSDTDFVSGSLRSAGNKLVKQDIIELSGGQSRTTSTNAVDWNSASGWYMDFNPGGKSPGELVNVDPQLILGTLVIVTAVPGGGACSVGGDGWMYQVNYETGKYIVSSPSQIAGRKQQGAMIVGVSIYQLGSGSIVANIRDSKATGTDAPIYTTPVNDKAKRAGWREIPAHK